MISQSKTKFKKFIAEIISLVLHPILMFVLISLVFIIKLKTSLFIYTAVMSPFAVAVSIYIIAIVIIKRKSDFDFTQLKSRPPLLMTASFSMFVSLILASMLAPQLSYFLTRIVVILLITSAVSFYWKISFHAISFSMAVAILSSVVSYFFLAAILLVPLLYWSRVYLRKHELAQLLVGSIVPLILLL